MRERLRRCAAAAHAAGAQHLLDGGQQPVAVVQHDAVELLALGLVHGAGLQGFQIQADGGDGSFQFVGDGVDEGVVLLVAADFAHQKDGIQHDAAADHQHQQDPEHQQDAVPPVQQEVADVENSRTEISPTPRAMKNGDRFAAPGEFHDFQLSAPRRAAGISRATLRLLRVRTPAGCRREATLIDFGDAENLQHFDQQPAADRIRTRPGRGAPKWDARGDCCASLRRR